MGVLVRSRVVADYPASVAALVFPSDPQHGVDRSLGENGGVGMQPVAGAAGGLSAYEAMAFAPKVEGVNRSVCEAGRDEACIPSRATDTRS